jgi:hypothetical protein
MTNQISQTDKANVTPCPPLADALVLHLDGRPGQLAGPWALGWDRSGLEAAGRPPALATKDS